jgi:hypothetical protein
MSSRRLARLSPAFSDPLSRSISCGAGPWRHDIGWQVGLNVQRLRRALDLSPEGLAFEASIHRTYISGVERGVRNMTVTPGSRRR